MYKTTVFTLNAPDEDNVEDHSDDYWKPVVGYLSSDFPGLAITPSVAKGLWHITHLKSGMRVASFMTKANAQKLATRIGSRYDWTQDRGAVLADGEAAYAILKQAQQELQ